MTERVALENVRLIYEQIESAKAFLLRNDVLDCRLALILLDNVAELVMARELRERYSFDDYFHPAGGQVPDPLPLKYTPEERSRADWEFEPKLRILGHGLGKLSTSERSVLRVCHRLRCEAFHVGTVRRTILSQATRLLFHTTVGLTLTMPIRAFVLPGPQPANADARFLERFGLGDAMFLAHEDGRGQIARMLLDGVTLNAADFATALSEDLVTRIDEHILGGLEYLNEADGADIDRNLQYGQFWQQEGIALAQAGVRQPHLDEAFDKWRAEGQAKFTIHKIERWRRHAELIARRERPSDAIEQWWAIHSKIQPLESGIGKAVSDYDDYINNQIH
jgi:hypothetical protein